jgi:hypothetical protein
MKNEYMVLHYSDNWMDGLVIHEFVTYDQALKYVKDFQSKSKEHRDDSIKIVKIEDCFKASEVDHGLFGFKVTK